MQSAPVTPKNIRVLRRDCKGCLSGKLRIAKLELEKDDLKRKLCDQKENFLNESVDIKRRLVEKSQTIKTVKKQFDRKVSIETSLRTKKSGVVAQLRNLTKRAERLEKTDKAACEMKNLKIKLCHSERMLGKKKTELDDLTSELRALKRENKELQDANHYLHSLLIEAVDKDGEEKELCGDRPFQPYCTNVRKATYKAILSQCPVAQVGSLLKTVATELSGKQIQNAPSKSTVARMAHELSVLSSIQTVECLLKSNVSTISWDATSEAGHHINEIHIRLDDGTSHTISIERLAGGKAQDYSNHIIRSIDEMCLSYAEYKGLQYIQVRGQVLSKIASTLTDRAIVNHAACRLIKLHLGLELIELNCNLHVLDGFANQVRSALKRHDSDVGLDGGNYCLASKVIYTISKLRYKNTGDPSGFRCFIRNNEIPAGMFVRYVGNRLHVMFHMGGVLVHFLPQLMIYLEQSCKAEYARQFLLTHLKEEKVIDQVRAL